MNALKILIVEDEGIAALSLKETLENFGYKVSGIAANQKEAIKSIKSNAPQLVLMDICLEGKQEGIAVGEEIMKEYELPVIFLTAFVDKETISKAKEVFPYGYMAKPYQEMELFAMIETAIHKHLADRSQKDLIRTKEKFFSVVAHDLRSPLAALEVTTRMLSKKAGELPAEDIKDFISEIHQTVEVLYSFTDNLLEWTKIQSGRTSVYPESLSLEAIIEQVFSLLNAKAKDKNISLRKDYQLEGMVWADVNMVRSVILNLVQNSLKFSEVGGRINVSVYKRGSFAEVSVQDKGIGIEEEQQKSLFNFANSRTTPGTLEEKGTGLGLLLCKEFIDANGGEISVSSRPGEGTEVNFTVPLLTL